MNYQDPMGVERIRFHFGKLRSEVQKLYGKRMLNRWPTSREQGKFRSVLETGVVGLCGMCRLNEERVDN